MVVWFQLHSTKNKAPTNILMQSLDVATLNGLEATTIQVAWRRQMIELVQCALRHGVRYSYRKD